MATDNAIAIPAESGCLHGLLRSVPENKRVALICMGVTRHLETQPLLQDLAKALEQVGWSSIRFDYRGRGQSSHAPDLPTVSSMLQDIAYALSYIESTFGKNPDAVIARGFGSRLALECMQQYPTIPLIMWAPIIWLQTSLDIRYRMHEHRTTGVMKFDDTEMEEVFLKSLKDPTDGEVRSWIVGDRRHLIVQGAEDQVVPMRLVTEARDLIEKAGSKPELFLVRGPHPHPDTDELVQPQIVKITEVVGGLPVSPVGYLS